MKAVRDADRPAGQVVRCAFCGKFLEDVAQMITTNRGINICDECVDLAVVLIAEARVAARPKESQG